MEKLDVIIPVINEARNIPELTRRLDLSFRQSRLDYRIIYVVDPSTDGTEEVVKGLSELYPVVLHRKLGKPGKAYSILEGLLLAETEYVATIDGDLQYPPEVIPQMLKMTDKFQLIVANRKDFRAGLIRQSLSKINRFILGKVLLGFSCDIQSGLKLFPRRLLSALHHLPIKAWSLDLPLLTVAKQNGYKIGTLDIMFSRRRYGRSNVKLLSTSWEIFSGAVLIKIGLMLSRIPLLSYNSSYIINQESRLHRFSMRLSLPYLAGQRAKLRMEKLSRSKPGESRKLMTSSES